MASTQILDTYSEVTLAGVAAGFGKINATVTNTSGTPSVKATMSGPDTAKDITLEFTNLKGDKGEKGNTGDSAYKAAQQAGYKGTQDQWAKSLRFQINTQITDKTKLPTSGLYTGYRAQTLDDKHVYEYNGSAWMDLGPLAANYEARQVFSVKVGDSGRAWFDRRGWEVDCWITFKPFTSASISSDLLDDLLAPQMPGLFPTVTVGTALSIPIGDTMPALDTNAIGPQMMLQITDKLILTRVDTKTAMPALTSGHLYYMHLHYRATNEMLESKPVYFTQALNSDGTGAVLTDMYTYATDSGISYLVVID